MRVGMLVAVTATLAACSYPTPSMADVRLRPVRGTALAQVEVQDRSTGEKLAVYWHNGQRWIAGTPGHRYSIWLRNTTSGRILGVVSVDGVNAVSGETASWNQGGYVLGPWQSFDVLGWRKSLDHVADFVFTSVPDSYAAQTGRPDNAGVIGVALFREAVAAPAPPVSINSTPPRAQSSAERGVGDGTAADSLLDSAVARSQAAPGASPLQQALGTGHGQAEPSLVATTRFEPAQAQPDEVISIRYDQRERLVALGVIAAPRPALPGPQPFPDSTNVGFVADPPSGIR